MKHNAGLAQLVEQLTSNLRVAGSIPALGAIFPTALLSLALALPGTAAAAKQPSTTEKASVQVSKTKAKKVARPQAKAKPASKVSSKAKAKPETGVSSKQSKKSRSKSKAEPVEVERSSKKSRTSRGKNPAAVEKRASAESAAVEPKRAVILEKAAPPVRTEQGCSGENGALLAVGQVMKSGGKTFRCQKTWDYNEGKLVGYPAWVELFMPTPGWGAGLKETPRPPADAVLAVPGAKAKVAPLADKQADPTEDDEASSDGVQNQLY